MSSCHHISLEHVIQLPYLSRPMITLNSVITKTLKSQQSGLKMRQFLICLILYSANFVFGIPLTNGHAGQETVQVFKIRNYQQDYLNLILYSFKGRGGPV